jgi:Protein of unknown function (DUF3577)
LTFVHQPERDESQSHRDIAIACFFALEIAMNRNTTQSAAANNDGESKDYFDLHVKGCGFLNRVREVNVKRTKDSFLACSISALHGPCDDADYSYFDFKVTGAEAEQLVRELQDAANGQSKVFVAFRAGDIYSEAYEADERDGDRNKTGRKVWRSTIKGRLLQITYAKVDDEVVFQLERSETGAEAEQGSKPEAEPEQATGHQASAPVGRSYGRMSRQAAHA